VDVEVCEAGYDELARVIFYGKMGVLFRNFLKDPARFPVQTEKKTIRSGFKGLGRRTPANIPFQEEGIIHIYIMN